MQLHTNNSFMIHAMFLTMQNMIVLLEGNTVAQHECCKTFYIVQEQHILQKDNGQKLCTRDK